MDSFSSWMFFLWQVAFHPCTYFFVAGTLFGMLAIQMGYEWGKSKKGEGKKEEEKKVEGKKGKGKKQEKEVRRKKVWREEGDDEDWEEFSAPKSVDQGEHIPLAYTKRDNEEMKKRSEDYYKLLNGRRSVRFFSDEEVDKEVIDNIVLAAGTAPSGAHTEPWTFCCVYDKEIKKEIREIIEEEEKINYEKRMGKQWVNDLKKIGTNWQKPYLEEAHCIIVMFKQTYGLKEGDGGREEKITHYYHEISASISAGLLISAIHNAGLVTLTSTPLNAGRPLRDLLERPQNEKVLLVLPVGFPSSSATVPDLTRKPLSELRFEY